MPAFNQVIDLIDEVQVSGLCGERWRLPRQGKWREALQRHAGDVHGDLGADEALGQAASVTYEFEVLVDVDLTHWSCGVT